MTVPVATVADMTSHNCDFDLNRPSALIAALPAVLGFTPVKSLVLVSVEGGELGAVMRIDLSAELSDELDRLAEVAAAAEPDAVIAVIVDADGASCPMCNDEHRQLSDDLAEVLGVRGIELWAVHVVDRVGAGGRWHCVDGCGSRGRVDDPTASPVTVAAVLDGRRLYASRAELQAVIAPEETDEIAGAPTLVDLIGKWRTDDQARRRQDPDGCARRDVRAALVAAARVADGEPLANTDIAHLGSALTDIQVRDTLYALAVGESASAAESLWAVLARKLPNPWRVEPLVLLAFSAYARGDGPLAGVSLEAALGCDPTHRMAGMLDSALQSGMRPEQIRELALTGYRLAEQLGIRLPPRDPFGRRAC
ncbi:DUF4192 domain-containing protein [soil metagenome]